MFESFFCFASDWHANQSVVLPDRLNEYDGEEEFWVTVKESGTKVETTSYEEKHQQEKEARTSRSLQVKPSSIHTHLKTIANQDDYCNAVGPSAISCVNLTAVSNRYAKCQASGDPKYGFEDDKFGLLDQHQGRAAQAGSAQLSPVEKQPKGAQACSNQLSQ